MDVTAVDCTKGVTKRMEFRVMEYLMWDWCIGGWQVDISVVESGG